MGEDGFKGKVLTILLYIVKQEFGLEKPIGYTKLFSVIILVRRNRQKLMYFVCCVLSSIQFTSLEKAQKGGCNPGGLSWGSSAPCQCKHYLIWREFLI